MEELIKRLILKLFPELSARYHLPLFAIVMGVRETPDHGDQCDEFRPYYAVDVQILNEYGQPDHNWPVLKDVIVSVPTAGHFRGQFCYPDNGTWVEIAFAYGSANRPFIRSILPHRLALPKIKRGEHRWQHNSESFQQIDKDGNQKRITDLTIEDRSLTRLIEAMTIVEQFHQANKTTETNDTELIGAIKTIEAFGAMILQSGGTLDLSAINHLRLTTKANAIIKVLGDIQQNIAGNTHSQTAGTQHFEADKSWFGSSNENALRLMSETAQLVIELANILATHTHPNTDTITQSGAVSQIAISMGKIKNRIDGIAE